MDKTMEKITKNKYNSINKESEDENKRKLPRVEKRRIRIKKHILEVATKKFALEGPENVRLELIADEVDISRASLYSFFSSKDELIFEIIKPVLEELIKNYEEIVKNLNKLKTDDVFDKLVELYISLWENYELAMLLAQRVLDMDPGSLKPLYERMLELKLQILTKFEKEKRLKLPKEVAFKVLLNILIPLLRFILPAKDGKKLFRSTLQSILIV